MLGIIIAITLSLIVVTTTTSIAGIALYTSLQTKHFVQE